MNKSTQKTVLFLIVILSVFYSIAQNAPTPNRPPPPPGIPVDGGLFALLTVAVGYAVKKLKIRK